MGKELEKEDKTSSLPRIKVKTEIRNGTCNGKIVDIDITGTTSTEVLGTFKEVLELVNNDSCKRDTP